MQKRGIFRGCGRLSSLPKCDKRTGINKTPGRMWASAPTAVPYNNGMVPCLFFFADAQDGGGAGGMHRRHGEEKNREVFKSCTGACDFFVFAVYG